MPFEDEHQRGDAGGEVPELTYCRGCGRSMHAVTWWKDPRCLACRLPAYRRTRPASRNWQPWEIALLVDRPELSNHEIGRRIGRSRQAVALVRWRLADEPVFVRRAWSPEDDALVLGRGESDAALAVRLGRSKGAIRTRRRNLRADARRNPSR